MPLQHAYPYTGVLALHTEWWPQRQRSPLIPSLTGCCTILLPGIDHQSQMPIHVDGQLGVLEWLRLAVDDELTHAIIGGMNVMPSPPGFELWLNLLQFLHQFMDVGFLRGTSEVAVKARQHLWRLFLPIGELLNE